MAFTEERLLDQLQELDPYEFEQFVADIWERQNWDTYVTTEAGDGGVDVIAEQTTPFNKKQVIQAKRYEPSNPVSRPDIQQYASIRQEQTDVDTVVVLTTSRFTDDAKNVAKKLNVKLIDGTRLYNLIDALDAFKLAQSYIDPRDSQDRSSASNVEGEITETSSDRKTTEEGTEWTNEFEYNRSVKNFPTYLPNIIKLREDIANELPKFQSEIDTAENAFNEGRYFDAVKQYEEIVERQEVLRREIARYDAGLTYLDRRTTEHLPDTEKFVTQIEQITEGVAKQYRQAFRIVERAQALDKLVDEIRKCVSRAEDAIDRGEQLRRSGNFEAADLKYDQAYHIVEIAYEPMEIYQELVTVYDDEVLESHAGLPEGVSLSKLETEISSRRNSTNEPLEIHTVAEEAAGSFSGTLLNENDGELFDKELLEYIGEEEKLEFVFEPPRMGFKITAAGENRERPQHDTGQKGASFLLITDQRILYVAGVDNHDVTRSIAYEQLSDMTSSVESGSRYLQFTDVEGTKYKFAGLRNHQPDIEQAAAFVREQCE